MNFRKLKFKKQNTFCAYNSHTFTLARLKNYNLLLYRSEIISIELFFLCISNFVV